MAHVDVLLEDYFDRNKDVLQIQVAERLGMSPSFICLNRGTGRFWLRLNSRREIIGHYIFKEAELEIPRRQKVARKRKRLKKKRSKR